MKRYPNEAISAFASAFTIFLKSLLMKVFLQVLLVILTFDQLCAQDDIVQRLEAIAHIDQKIMMPMRDGVRLCTDIYRPKTNEAVPVIFSRTPYNFNSWRDGERSTRTYQRAYEAVSRGYAYVVQNERGRFFSEGEWDILGVPLTDGYDAFTWLEDQTWCNGKIGTYGCSSTAEWQMAVASLDHPAHAAMVPMGFGAGVGRVGRFHEQGNWYRGGAQQMLFTSWLYSTQHDAMSPKIPDGATREDLLRLQRFYDMAPEYPRVDWKDAFSHLPVSDIIRNVHGPTGIYEDMILRKPNDPAWYDGGLYHDDMPFSVPSFWFCSWYDVSISPNLELFNHVRERMGPRRRCGTISIWLLLPPYTVAYQRATENTIVGEMSVGDARLDYDGLIYGWFDHWLKGEDKEEVPRVQFYTMGSNTWQTATSWPPQDISMQTFYLSSDGAANSLFGDGRLVENPPNEDQADHYTYNPMNYVPSLGGNVCCTGGAIDGGAFDQRYLETRHDILVYSTPALAEDVEVTGFIEATLYVSSDAKDTDFTLKLVDVHPDGTAYNLDETIMRARYRTGFTQEVFMEKGEVYPLEMSPMATSNVFKRGHRIRIEVSSSNFPRFTRNLNTGGNNFDEATAIIARNSIHHSSEYPSQIRLPTR